MSCFNVWWLKIFGRKFDIFWGGGGGVSFPPPPKLDRNLITKLIQIYLISHVNTYSSLNCNTITNFKSTYKKYMHNYRIEETAASSPLRKVWLVQVQVKQVRLMSEWEGIANVFKIPHNWWQMPKEAMFFFKAHSPMLW